MATQRYGGYEKKMDANEEDSMSDSREFKRDKISKDKWSIALLLLLYTLQGIPMGLAASIPMVLQAKKVGYRQQALFSLVSWPFSVKLLWAPLVDAFYSRSFGRRKSWLIPTQYVIGFVMLVLSYYMDDLLGSDKEPPRVMILTVVFFVLFVCAATQDIAVDGWALTILSRENVGHASTCNSVGQTAGYFLGYTIFLALESKEFCNTYLRWGEPQNKGLVDLPEFLFFWGVVFIIVTTLVWVLKKETKEPHTEIKEDILSAYGQLLNILKLKSVQAYVVFALTSKIGLAAAEHVAGLKIIEAGLPREKLALIAVPMVPLQIILPLIISRYTTGPRPLDLFMKAMPIRLVMGVVFAGIVWWTSVTSEAELSMFYYFVIITIFIIHQIPTYSMFVATMGFHARISDPIMGGTYMTLLNTVTNLGSKWPGTLVLWLVDIVSLKGCEGVTDLSLDCDTLQEVQACKAAGGHCVTYLDGYYVETLVCFIIGLLWIVWQSRRVKKLQELDSTAWKIQ